tara:strand:- start:565 stop:1086 length:522 start_codon:yes stop_codon:yes gene_type:complete
MNTSKEIEQAKQLLKDNGFYIENLWHVDDVKYGGNSEDKYIECTNYEAYEILSEAVQQESINESIFDNIQAINETKFRTMNTLLVQDVYENTEKNELKLFVCDTEKNKERFIYLNRDSLISELSTSEELSRLKDLFEKLIYMQHVTFSEEKQSEKDFMEDFNNLMNENIDLLH